MTLLEELEEARKIVELYAHGWGSRGHTIIEKNSMEFAASLGARAAHIRKMEHRACATPRTCLHRECRMFDALTGPTDPSGGETKET